MEQEFKINEYGEIIREKRSMSSSRKDTKKGFGRWMPFLLGLLVVFDIIVVIICVLERV